jgi:DNA-binding IclR family transcriptional regulator
MGNDYSIQAVVRAIDVLDEMSRIGREFSITDLIMKTGMPKSYLFRLLQTLQSKQFLDVNSINGKYRLGLKTVAMGQTAIRQLEIAKYSGPALLALKNSSGETSFYARFDGANVRIFDVVHSDQPVRAVTMVGSRLPLHCTAAGKLQMAFSDAAPLSRCLDDCHLEKFGPNTIIARSSLLYELSRIMDQGYAVEDEEFEAGVGGVAVPVMNRSNKLAGILGIVAPVSRLNRKCLENELIPLVVSAGEEFSATCNIG